VGYPQPNSNQAVINGDTVFRLHTKLISAGDTYDSEQSGYAFAIGPDSDIANVNINYFDQTLPTRMNQVTIGTGSPYVGLIQARLEEGALYQPQGVPGRIIFSPGDIVPILLEVLGFPVPPENQVRVSPVLDIVQYLTPVTGSIVAPRNDRHYLFATGDTTNLTNDVMIYEVPFYGRSYACISSFLATATTSSVSTMKIEGLRFGYGISDVFDPNATTIYATGNLATKEINAATDGFFDYLRITIGNTPNPDGLIILDIKTSDTAK
jgi:hypothetical protein